MCDEGLCAVWSVVYMYMDHKFSPTLPLSLLPSPSPPLPLPFGRYVLYSSHQNRFQEMATKLRCIKA